MFRLASLPRAIRQDANEWIYKMLFLWAREPIQRPRAGPWLAWFATALVIWRCRRRIARFLKVVSPMGLIRTRRSLIEQQRQRLPARSDSADRQLELDRKSRIAKARVKRLQTGDGHHVTGALVRTKSQHVVNYRVTRSGRVYGKYQHRIVTPVDQ